ncbi:Uncharacterised protein [uncultured archaeon]|nr:Uncharacterised protein [uncultured archaeon]
MDLHARVSSVRPLAALLVLSLAFLLLLGCAGSPPPAAPAPSAANASASNASSPGARLIQLQASIQDQRAQMADVQARLSRATGIDDRPAIHVQMQALGILSENLSSSLEESCELSGHDCGSDLRPVRQLSSCAGTYARYEGADQLYRGASQALSDCRASCAHNDTPATCLVSCNPSLKSLQDACRGLQPLLSSVRSVCSQTLSDSFYSTLSDANSACEQAAAAEPYAAPAPAANDTPAPKPADLGPLVSGRAEVDSDNGAFSTRFCRIHVTPSVIQQGQETMIDIYAYAGSGEDITYTCGDLTDPRSAGYGGLLGPTSRLCPYYDAGPTTVWVALNGYVCASAPLDVDSTQVTSVSPSCRIAANTQSMNRSGTTTTYSAAVRVRHAPSSATVRWGCDSETFNATLGQFWSGDDISGVVRVSCTFNQWSPSNAPGRVSLGNLDCGPMQASG